MPISDWADCMPTDIDIASFVSHDKYGERSFGAPSTVKGRLQYREERITIPSGEEQVARGRIYLAELTSVQPEDMVTLPNGETPEILSVRRVNDENGPHHEVIFFK